jgi:catechol 2,3-dioxygenase-like lactoylglutathione lyase family enzyme
MQAVNRLKMLAIGVSNMEAAKEFYGTKLGLQILSDYRQDDSHWWVTLQIPEGGITITLTTYHANTKPGATTLWFVTSDLEASYSHLSDAGLNVNDIKDDLYGPGSGVKFFNFEDPDGNLIHIEQG